MTVRWTVRATSRLARRQGVLLLKKTSCILLVYVIQLSSQTKLKIFQWKCMYFYFGKNACSFLHTFLLMYQFCLTTIRAVRFSCVSFGWRIFYYKNALHTGYHTQKQKSAYVRLLLCNKKAICLY